MGGGGREEKEGRDEGGMREGGGKEEEGRTKGGGKGEEEEYVPALLTLMEPCFRAGLGWSSSHTS